MIVLLLAVYSACIGVVMTKLTDIGESIGFKPFNCYICLSWWIGIAHGCLGLLTHRIDIIDVVGVGGLSSILAYIFVDVILYRNR
jgi:hypothetical protein